MDKKTLSLIKGSYKNLFETLQRENNTFVLVEDILVFLLTARIIDPVGVSEDELVWGFLFARHEKAVNKLIPWFSDLHRRLPVSDSVVRDIWAGIDKECLNNLTALLGIIHETALAEAGTLKNNASGSPVRKKQGSYYTSSEIVNYMVDISLGRLLTAYRQKLRDVLTGNLALQLPELLEEIRQLRVVDPACGSAAFLSVIIQELKNFYGDLPDGIVPELPAVKAIEHIYGTDTDSRAVDLTVLGLALDCCADRGYAEAEKYIRLLRRKIRVGNALTMDWQQEFPEVFEGSDAGFALVIGNPPYISNKLLPVNLKEYINRNYHTAEGQYDIIVPFIENGLANLRTGGQLCVIISNKYLAADYGRKLRAELLLRHSLLQICDLSSLNVFSDAAVYPVIQVIKKGREDNAGSVGVREVHNIRQLKDNTGSISIPEAFFRRIDDMIITPKLTNDIWPVLEAISRIPGRIPAAQIYCGIAQTGFAKQVIMSETYQQYDEELRGSYRKFLNSGHIDKYVINGTEGYISYHATTKRQWESFAGRKLVIAGMAKKIEAAVDEQGCALGRVYYIREVDVTYNLYYLCALLNSKLLDFYYRVLYWPVHLQGGYYRFNSTYLARLPVVGENENREMIAEIIHHVKMLVHKPVKQKILDEIDRLVFRLYGLSDEQIATINNFS